MDWFQIVILALVQGITEFLPISSSGHLLLPKVLLGWQDQGLAFDVAVHLGSLSAVVIYFYRDLRKLTKGFLAQLFAKKASGDADMFWYIGYATVPAVVAGLMFDDFIEENLRTALVLGLATAGFGLLLWWSELVSRKASMQTKIDKKSAILIGAAQALALIPGTSRSGITITAALLLGYSKQTAARFSFLLSIPLILAAGSYKALQLVTGEEIVVWTDLLIGALLSGVSAYFCIHLFLKLIDRVGLIPFAIYRLFLGGVLLYLYFM